MYKVTGIFAFLFIAGTIAVQAQSTHIVDLSGTGDFTTIHDAVNAASSGDTIRVQPDQYAFTADLGAVEVTKKLVIIGSGYMPVEEGGSELVDISGSGFFDLTGSADGTVIKGFRVQGATDFIDSESGTSDVIVEENLFITGEEVLDLRGNADTVRSNIFFKTASNTIYLRGTNTKLHNNIFAQTQAVSAQWSAGRFIHVTNGINFSIAYNLFINNESTLNNVISVIGNPEIYSNAFVNYNPSNSYVINSNGDANPYSTNNGFYKTAESFGLNPVTNDNPAFVDFDADNDVFDIEFIDENNFDLHLDSGSPWIDTGRTGTLYLDTDGSRSDIGIYGGPEPFKDGKGAPSIPVVIDFQVTPTTVSPSGTITIKATGRIGSGSSQN